MRGIIETARKKKKNATLKMALEKKSGDDQSQ